MDIGSQESIRVGHIFGFSKNFKIFENHDLKIQVNKQLKWFI